MESQNQSSFGRTCQVSSTRRTTHLDALSVRFPGLMKNSIPQQSEGGGYAKWPDSGCVIGPTRTVAWRVLDAQYFRVAQRRRRVFVVASARSDFHPAQSLFEFEGLRRNIAPSRKAWEAVAPTIAGCSNGGGANGPGRDVDSCESLQPVVMAHGQGGAEVSVGRCPTLTCNHEAPIAFHWNAQPDQMVFSNDTAAALTCSQFAAVAVMPTMRSGGKSGSPSHGQVSGDTCDEYIVPVAFQSSQSGVRLGDVHATLDANNGSNRHNGVLQNMQVRRLTPRECERLQGLHDDYTLIEHYECCGVSFDVSLGKYGCPNCEGDRVARLKSTPDGPRYKVLGNSMAVTVMNWIGRRIEFALSRPWNNEEL